MVEVLEDSAEDEAVPDSENEYADIDHSAIKVNKNLPSADRSDMKVTSYRSEKYANLSCSLKLPLLTNLAVFVRMQAQGTGFAAGEKELPDVEFQQCHAVKRLRHV